MGAGCKGNSKERTTSGVTSDAVKRGNTLTLNCKRVRPEDVIHYPAFPNQSRQDKTEIRFFSEMTNEPLLHANNVSFVFRGIIDQEG